MNAKMLKLIADEDVKPLTGKVAPFDQIIEGLTVIKNHKIVGRLVVKVD